MWCFLLYILLMQLHFPSHVAVRINIIVAKKPPHQDLGHTYSTTTNTL